MFFTHSWLLAFFVIKQKRSVNKIINFNINHVRNYISKSSVDAWIIIIFILYLGQCYNLKLYQHNLIRKKSRVSCGARTLPSCLQIARQMETLQWCSNTHAGNHGDVQTIAWESLVYQIYILDSFIWKKYLLNCLTKIHCDSSSVKVISCSNMITI